ncbi:MAG: GTP cyclohydrolase I FolE [Bacteroidota bacterium]
MYDAHGDGHDGIPFPEPVNHYVRQDSYDHSVTEDLKKHYRAIIDRLGENVEREGLLKTPERVSKAMQFLTQGYKLDAQKILQSAVFEEDYNEMILVKDIEVYSLCEHHMLPFIGKAHVAYIPNGRIVGLSKVPRIVDVFARRLQVQERLTMQVRDAITEALDPQGVAVVIEATHMCMVMRGVEKQNSSTITSAMNGEFMLNKATRAEFMRLVQS